jgi:L-histidine Nalpha-methyltransferase
MIDELKINEISEELVKGLLEPQKRISSKYFYDKRGSELFDQICELDEYYLTRTEWAILKENISCIAECFTDDSLLVEFGSGSSTKTRLLLENIKNLGGYVPIDISKKHLNEAVSQLNSEFPGLEIYPLAADYTKPLSLPEVHNEAEQRIIFFPGSTLGNFTKNQAREFLELIRSEIREGDGFILGVDLVKDTQVLKSAYNDSRSVTADFNLNILQNVNNNYGSNFNIKSFKHDAIYNTKANRIEMYLISLVDQVVEIGDTQIQFSQNEKLLTEYSHKYTVDSIEELSSGLFTISKVWTDPKNYFAVIYLVPI